MKREPIEIIPYQQIWNEQFQTAKNDLQNCLNGVINDIEHIGSTSIDGMPSKNRIDIQIGITDISSDSCDVINERLKPYGFPKAYLSSDHLPPNESDERQWQKIYLKGVNV